MRRLAIILGGIGAGVLLAATLLPWWLGPALRTLGRSHGVTFASYERIGYGRFALHNLRLDQPAALIEVARVEADTPLLWARRRWFGTPGPVLATRWDVTVRATEREQPEDDGPPLTNIDELRARLFSTVEQLEQWVPRAETGAGEVRWADREVAVERATWRERRLVLEGVALAGQTVDAEVTLTDDREIAVSARAAEEEWRLALRNVGRDVTGEFRLWAQTATLRASWPASGWWPEVAQVRAENWELPGARLKLGESYAFVRGDVRIDWRNEQFDTVVQVSGEPLDDGTAPPLRADLRGHGDLDQLTIESLAVEIPGVNAKLTEPIVLDRQGRMQSAASRFVVAADLAEQPWFEARGRVDGEIRVIPRDTAVPRVEAALSARGVGISEWELTGVAAEAVLEWPRLEVERAVLNLAQNEELAVRGGWDFVAREFLPSEAKGTITGAALAPWLPEGLGFEAIEIDARAQGPVATVQHEGRLRVQQFVSSATKPMDVAMHWTGEGEKLAIEEGTVRAGDSAIDFAASLDRAGASATRLDFTQGDAPRLRLVRPAAIRWSPDLAVDSLQLTGPEGSIAVAGAWGPTGRADVALRNVPSTWWTDFFAMPETEWTIGALEGNGTWDRSPIRFTTAGDVVLPMGPERHARAAFKLSGDGSGVAIESLSVAEGAAPVVTATGRVPLTLRPDLPTLVQFSPDAPLQLEAKTAPNPLFWQKLTELTGLELKDPSASIRLSGTWAQPQGEVRIEAARVSRDPARLKMPLPTIEQLDVLAIADRTEVRLEHLNVTIEGQAVRARGQLGVSPAQWNELRAKPLDYLRQHAELRLEIPDADMAAIARYVPKYLAPVGRLQVDAALRRGGEMEGSLVMRDAASRPLGPLGVLQEIGAELRFAGRQVELRGVTARMGGQPVTLSGTVALPAAGPPRFELALKGENLPFVRQTGLLLRGDLDLKLVTGGDQVTRITGTTTLRDSLFLSDVRALIPRGGRAGATKRPPFFSVDVPPLDDWRLAVDVRGDHFMRLRTTVFGGVVSAYFRLTGTLGDPRATGEAIVESGQVRLPFATFNVRQGAVRLTEADPYEPQILLTGESRRFGYDVRMELSGSASAPTLTFSSSPPLDAEQVLLMVMAGEAPQDEVTYTGRQRVTRLGTYLGQSLINSLGGDSADANRLTFSSGERVSRQGRETYNIEYELNHRATLVGEYDEFDEYNAGIKWRLFAEKPNGREPGKNADEK